MVIRMGLHQEIKVHPENDLLLKFIRRFVSVTENYEHDRFFVRRAGQVMVTPLLLVLLVIDTTDLIFAVDSIPAVFAVTRDPFLVYTSNIFAILGLRSLYFVFAGIMDKFHYLQTALAIILVYVGVKMVLADIF